MRVFTCAQELAAAVGQCIGPGPWQRVDQARLDAFADATGEPRCAGLGAAAPGWLTLSLLPMLVRDVYRFDNVRLGVDYGVNRVRFPAPVPVGAAVRLLARIAEVEPVTDGERAGGVQLVAQLTVRADGQDKPCCVAETVSRIYFEEEP
ncbi:MaoC family dehydratase [Catellatospora sp. NPDC049609]|uniref:MaoC family dehydratase n=1 Tax=Catellatospora sp. NPDC049609 TaxID=3155505 RepID=UPI003442A841